MMLSRKWTLAAIAAVLIAVAGCSSSGDKKVADTTTEPDLEKVAGLFATAQDARSDADGASEAAAQAVTDAKKYSDMLSTMAVHGVSATAEKNAQMVLDARDAADQAVEDAEAAKASAATAKIEAEKLPADDPNKASLVAALDAAIKAAEEAIKAAKKSQGDSGLTTAVTAVVSEDKKEPKTPADVGKTVAKKIGKALKLQITPSNGSELNNPSLLRTLTRLYDRKGQTWAEIVGASNIVNKRIGNTSGGDIGADSKLVDAVSMDGMVVPSAENTPVPGDANDGDTYAGSYKGIEGMVFCHGNDCKMTADRKVTGSWFFTPGDSKKFYVMNTEGTGYKLETLYTEYGHWLTVENNGDVMVNTYAKTFGNTAKLNVGVPDAATTNMLVETVTYNGSAAGMSQHKTFDAQGDVDSNASGNFIAAVTLTAKFGQTPTLGGEVHSFKGSAVDPRWRIILERGDLNPTTARITGGDTKGPAADATAPGGAWSAQGYGAENERPTGFFGSFQAHFTDGHAAGAYSTRKQ
jgi:hypothetical protein